MKCAFNKAAVVVFVLSGWVHAATLVKSGTFGGLRVDYKVLLPSGYDAAREYPTVLAFAGGSQDMPIVDNGLNRYWGLEGKKRGYVVVSPAAPPGQLFHQGGAKVFPEFLDMIVREYKPLGGKMHVAGFSNGGLSAFYVASRYPKYFWTVTGMPGLLDDATDAAIEALRGMCIEMMVGGNDTGWRGAMERQAKMFEQKGYTVQFHVEEGQGHVLSLGEDGDARLFDRLDAASRGCSNQAREK